MIKWISLFILTMATVIIQLFIVWIVEEKDILKINKNLMLSELHKLEKLELLDSKIQKVFSQTNMKVSDKKYARKKLLNFFDNNQKEYNLLIREYFNSEKGMLYMELTARLHDIGKFKRFLRLFDTSVLMELLSLSKRQNTIDIRFKVFYPFKEYL